jgi:hypothetical protein
MDKIISLHKYFLHFSFQFGYLYWLNVYDIIFFIISQNVAICPKTFSSRIDTHY